MRDRRQAETAARLAEAAALAEARAGAAAIGRFLADLAARGPAEDIAPYGAAELLALAEEAWRLLAERPPGRPLIRVFNPAFEAGGKPHPPVAVIDIVNDDMPFLLDSVLGELTNSGLEVDLVLHPVFAVERDAEGRLRAYCGPAGTRLGPNQIRESVIHIHVGRIASEPERAALAARLEAVLADVRLAVGDWKPMLARLGEVIREMQGTTPPVPVEEAAEAIEFLRWLGEDNFTFLGMRDYVIEGEGDDARLVRADMPAFGVLRDPSRRVLRRGAELLTSTPDIRDALARPTPLVITKANLKSRVHRRVHMDYVGVKRYRADGRLSGELRILGLFTSTAYTRSTRSIPYLRRKVDRVIAQAGFDPRGHSGKALLNVLESLPRDELLQLDRSTLFDWAMQILALEEHPRVRVLFRLDVFNRFVSALVFVPRDRYSTEIRIKIGELLEKAFSGRIAAFLPAFPEGSLARVHFIVGRPDPAAPLPAQEEIEATIAAAVRSWTDSLVEALFRHFGPTEAILARERYAKAFSAAYQDHFAAEAAIADIRAMERLSSERPLTIDFRAQPDLGDREIALKLFRSEAPVPLSERVPVLENMGFRVISERTYRIAPAGRPKVFMHEMMLERADREAIDEAALDARLEDLFLAVWSGAAENDGFNALALLVGLPWREIACLRAIARYLRQIGIAYSQDYLAATLVRHSAIAARLVELFRIRFDPDFSEPDRAAAFDRARSEFLAAVEAVSVLDEDRILRRFGNAIGACLRTNVFQFEADGEPRRTFAFKFDSKRLDDMPDPKPFREIWVYSPRVEGVHLRFGRIARGGLRWSDRPQDFRTEVLGLVKAQQVKNAVIVPVGAKGGFVPKACKPNMSRDEWLTEGTAAYAEFVRTLLTLTDNLDGDLVRPPDRAIRYDGDDPYLVVAADKGTATFSDLANSISAEAGFWLGDAFASGGSAGYDHKKMGITARGAFEAVERHFREMDVDILSTPFTVAGIGDMSGDVFGNGMLLARTIKLVAAFDHRDIFIDPSPDPDASFEERRRLFETPRSSWQDYDRAKLSPGGGIFSRNAKSIELSREVQTVLNFERERATPQEIVRAILKAPVDLFWFGGIGTYVRAAEETDAEVGDRANDAIRITASELGAKVVGEGANLGMTQLARVAYAARGGRCNSDAIDNSAGVNSSDVEVNIKIGLGNAIRAGRLDLARRNRLLAEMTNEVASLVLANNRSQTLAISVTERRGLDDFGYQRRLIQILEARGLLDRKVEAIPNDAILTAREKSGKPLTRPEIGVLLAYAKLALKEDLLLSAVPDDPALEAVLLDYFPALMAESYAADIAAHRLRREITITRLVNAMIDRGGPTLLPRVSDQTGATAPDVAFAFSAARAAFSLDALDAEIGALDLPVSGACQLGLYRTAQDLLLGAIVWFLRHVSFEAGIAPIAERFSAAVSDLAPKLLDILPEDLAAPARAEAAALAAQGVPAALGRRIALLGYEADIPDIALVAERTGASLAAAARTYFEVAHRFRIRRLEEKARNVAVADYFDGLALDRAKGALSEAHRRIAADAMANGGVEGWIAERERAVDRTLAAVAEITAADSVSVSRLAVAAGLLADLAPAA